MKSKDTAQQSETVFLAIVTAVVVLFMLMTGLII